MFGIIEYIGKIRDHLRKDPANYDHIFKLLADTEHRTWSKIRRMKSQVERCRYPKKEECEICRILLGEGEEER